MAGSRFLAGALLLTQILPIGAQQPPKPPQLPTINPAQARLDQTIGALDGPGLAIACNEEAGIVAAACELGTIQYWSKEVTMGVRAGERTPNQLQAHRGPVTALAWTAGPLLASVGTDQKLILWDLADGKARHTITLAGPLRALAMSPDGKLVAGGGDGGVVTLWETATGKVKAELKGHADWVLALAFSPDGKQLASGGYDENLRLWDVAAGKQLRTFPGKPPTPPKGPPPPDNILQALTFSPDGNQLAVGGTDTQVHLFNVADGKLLRSMPGHNSSVTALAFHPGGTLLVSASKDRSLRLWNPTNAQAIKTLDGHTAWVQGVVFLAQGTRLASVGADQTVRLWELK